MNNVAIAPAYIHASIKRRKNTWYSIANGLWTDKNIWISNAQKRWDYPGQVPALPQIGDDVFINHSITLNTANLIVNNLFVAGILYFDTTTARTLRVNGDLQATGTISLTGASHNLNLYGVNNFIVNFIRGTLSNVSYNRFGDQNIMPLVYTSLTTNSNIGIKYFPSGADVVTTFNINANTNLSANANITGGVTISNNVIFEFLTYDIFIGGSVAFQGGTLNKTGAGNVTFAGVLSTTGNTASGINFPGNPTVDMRGGISNLGAQAPIWNTGTGNWNFTTNNQTVIFNVGAKHTFSGNVNVVGAITVTNGNAISQIGFMVLNAPLNGTVAGSAFINKAHLYFAENTLPMATGSFDKDTYPNMVGYIANGSFTLPYATYQGLVIGGTGTKTAGASYTLAAGLTLGHPSIAFPAGTLEMSTYNLTVTGNSLLYTSCTLSKNAAGAVVFGGSLATFTGGMATINFTGNPTVEVKNGINFQGASNIINSGTGQWSFTTNNQSVFLSGITINAPFLISGAITLTLSGAGVTNVIFSGLIDGNNAASTFDNRITGVGVHYQNAVKPMVTGILQTNAAENTFIYNKAGDQQIKEGTYRTLTLAGSGIKTLQGNVVVATLYTLTAPATLNLNGFTQT